MFDKIMPEKLINFALDAGCPAKHLRMSMTMHMAPGQLFLTGACTRGRFFLPAAW